MIDWFLSFSPWQQALMGTLFTYGMTALGAGLVFFFKVINKRMLNVMLGFASGVMIAASFWSLLAPAIEMAEGLGMTPWLVATIGFLLGAFSLYIADKLIPHMHFGDNQTPEGPPSSLRRSILLVLSITLHNIPEGLAVGVAFGAVAFDPSIQTVMAGVILAIGIGIQNFPEGAAVSIPLRREGFSRRKAFFYGQLSGMVEPIAGVLGALLVTQMQFILPYALAYAAGAMIYVVVEELIPEAQLDRSTEGSHYATWGIIIGFTVMMILDVMLG